MSLLLIIWSVSLAILSVILGVAFAHQKRGRTDMGKVSALPSGFGKFLGDQCHEVLYRIQRGVHHIKPHAKNLGMIVVEYSAWGHDLFVERVFGRMETKKGVSTSFFLKNIAEHKVGRRADGMAGKV